MNRTTRLILATLAAAICFAASAFPQCPATNTAIQPGEKLDYDLYFNWKFVWIGAGTASMSTVSTTYGGKPALKSTLVTRTSKKVDKHFMMRDTLQSVVSQNLVPLYYKKAANEGSKYYVDQVWYSYQNGTANLKQKYQNRKGEITDQKYSAKDCIYDMLSMMLRARSFEATRFHKNDRMKFPMASGKRVEEATLVYRGKENFRMRSTGITYRCLIFSFVEMEKGKEKDIITFYITDDDNHIPVRLDMFLRFGTAKAFLSKASNLRHECSSIVEK